MQKREITLSPAGSLNYTPELKTALAIHAYEYYPQEITLASGKKSHDYIDCRRVALSPIGHECIGRVFWAYLKNWSDFHSKTAPIFDGIAGVALGACPIASATSLIAHLGGDDWPVLLVRKEPKSHGVAGSEIEGVYNFKDRPKRVVLLEDVLTSGNASLKAIQALEKAGFETVHTMALIDREEGAKDAFQAQGRTYTALFTLNQIKTHRAQIDRARKLPPTPVPI